MTKVGRHNDYKSDPSCIHIGDLKVPKTYISISVGDSVLASDLKSPISITFESICKTTVNGELYRLASRDDSSFTKEFTDDNLLLTVNAHKTNRIRIKIDWIPLNVMPFSKKIEYNGEIQESPLPRLLEEMHSSGIDIRMCSDPLLATHYLTLSDHVDYALQIAVLRAIPVVTTAWTDFIQRTPHMVEEWLFQPRPEFLLPNTANDYVFPNAARTFLLSGKSIVLCYQERLKHLSRLEAWVKILGCNSIQLLNINDSVSSITKIHAEFTAEDKYAFSVDSDENICREKFKDLNTSQDLWTSVITLSTLNLKPLKKIDKSDVVTSKNEESTPKFSQRRKRRKVERVSETDFFQFSHPSSSYPAQEADSLRINEVLEETFVPVESKEVERLNNESLEANNARSQNSKPPPISQAKSIELGDEAEKDISHTNEHTPKEQAPIEPVNDEGPALKKMKTSKNSNWIVPQVSLAEAIRTTKEESDKSAKRDTLVDNVDGELQKLVLIEEVELVVRRRQKQVPEVDSRYEGRPNFKAFKRKTNTASNVTRTYLQLFDDNSLSEMRFIGDAAASVEQAPKRILQDFELEMDRVRGFQPLISQLFVDEASDESDTGDAEEDGGFSFLRRRRSADTHMTGENQYDDGDDYRDDFTFAFSRK